MLVLEGWALVAAGQFQEGIQPLPGGLASLGAMGADASRSSFLGWLADVSVCADRREIGLEALAKRLGLMRTSGKRWWQAKPDHIHGELLLKPPLPASGANKGNAGMPVI